MKASAKRAGYWKPHEFPYELFVHAAVVVHLEDFGFVLTPSGHADIICWHRADEGMPWHIEAKGKTSAMGWISMPLLTNF